MSRRIVLEMDDMDYDAIQKAMAKRQSWRFIPDAECGNIQGAVIAEICRGWLEKFDCDDDDQADWWKK